MDLKECQKALDKAKIALMTKADSVFFCDVAFSFKYVWDETIPTAAVDGVHIFLNPDFFMAQSHEERIGLILHETLHPVYMHLDRLGSRDPQKWNIAGDHVINLMLLERGFKIPACGFADPQYKGMNTDQVYKLLPETPPDNQMEDLLPPALPPEELQSKMEDILVRASIRSKQENDKPGVIPGDIELFLDALLKPKLPWQSILQRFFNTFAKTDYSFRKPNRRHFPDHYLPSMSGTTLCDLVVGVDISGSVQNHEFSYFVSEIAQILRMCKPEKITLIQFDTSIKHVDEIRSIPDLMNIKFTGRGGTAIAPLIEWANTNKPQALLVFTDGEFKFRSIDSCKSPVIWMIHGKYPFKPPFGKTVNYEIPNDA